MFAAQPPGFYWILQSIAAVLGDQPERVRLGHRDSSPSQGRPAHGSSFAPSPARSRACSPQRCCVISPPIPLFAARILADLPSLWVTLAALGLGAFASRRRLAVVAAAAGAASPFAAIAIKVAAVIALPVLVVVLLSGGGRSRQRLAWAAAGAAVVAGVVLLANVGAIRELWGSVVTYHRKAGGTPAVIDRWASIGDLFNPRTPVLWLVVAGARRVRVPRPAAARTAGRGCALWGWALVAFLFLATYAPLHYNHLVALPVPLALAAGASLGAQVAVRARPRHARSPWQRSRSSSPRATPSSGGAWRSRTRLQSRAEAAAAACSAASRGRAISSQPICP